MNHIRNLFKIKEKWELDDLVSQHPALDLDLQSCSKDSTSRWNSFQEEIGKHRKQFKSHIKTTNEMAGSLQSLQDSLLEDIKSAQQSFDSLVHEVNTITSSIAQVHIVCEIHESLENLRNCCKTTDYLKIVELMHVPTALFKTLPQSPEIPFILSLKDKITEERRNAYKFLSKEYSKNCRFVGKEQTYEMKIYGGNLEKLHSLFRAINQNCATRILLTFTLPLSIWDNLFFPMIKNGGEISELHDEFSIFRVTVSNEKRINKYVDVYQNITCLITFLAKFLDCLLDDEENLLHSIGDKLKKLISQTIKYDCVIREIPEDWKERSQFKDDLVESTKLLEDSLRPYGFIDKRWDWVDNIEEMYKFERKCKYFQDEADALLGKDLLDTIEIGTPDDTSTAASQTKEFSQCSISSHIPELIKLGDELINEISEGPNLTRAELFATYTGIFFYYGVLLADHHKKSLRTSPEQIALFHNNCMYMYRQLQKWDDMFQSHPVLKKFCDASSKTYVQVGTDGRLLLDSYVKDQKERIEVDLKLKKSRKNRKTLESLEENTEKRFRECLRQLECLKNVWSKLLPNGVQNKAIGDILNAICDFLINSLVVLDSMTEEVAEKLIVLLKIVRDEGGKLFKDPNELFYYVPQWPKFNELIFILEAPYPDLRDKWDHGKGPLALHFSDDEFKNLCRFLFRNKFLKYINN